MLQVFTVLNTSISKAIGALEYAEVHTLFESSDVWHNPVRTPRQLHSYQQAHAAGAFVQDASSGLRLVAAPVFVEPL